jgi:tetratricopeptide (TPR) repeat protein
LHNSRSADVRHAVRGAPTPLRVATALLAVLLGGVLGALADPGDEDPSGPSADPDVVAGKKAIDDKRWADAIKALSSAALRDTRNADIQNYLGYAYRNVSQMDKAFAHYERALKLNPRHRGAHEYVGEAYLIVGKPAQAQEHLKALQAICLLPCEELDDLKAKIDRYQREARKP